MLQTHLKTRSSRKHLESSAKKEKQSNQSAARQSVARMLILQDGTIGFCMDEFKSILGCEEGDNAANIIDFQDSEDALDDRGGLLFGAASAKEDSWMTSIREGTHDVVLPSGKIETLHFSRLDRSDETLIIVSTINARAPAKKTLEKWIEKTYSQDNADENKQSQNFKFESEDAGFTEILELSHDVLTISDSSGDFVKVNDVFMSTLGYSYEQIEKLSFIDIIHPDDRSAVRPLLSALLNGETDTKLPVEHEARVVSRSGKAYWMRWRQKISGNMLYSVGHDISHMKTQEEALIKQKKQLSEAQKIGHMGHWIWRIDDHSIEWSEEIYRIFGQTKKEFEPKIESISACLYKRDLGRMMQAFQRAMIEKKDYAMEFRIKRPDGDVRFIDCQGRCELDDNGEVMSLFGVMQDVTERHEQEQKIIQAKEDAERAYASKSQFLANMSHELRTPLNAIIGFSEMIERQLLGPIGNEKYLDYIKGVRESGEHLLDLISDILDMSRIEAGKYELNREDVNVTKLVKLAAHMMESRAMEGELKVVVASDNDDLNISADRRAVLQVLLNLLSNAVKFTEKGGQIDVNVAERDDYILLKVQDNGIGIPAHKISAILQPFEQVCNQYSRDHEGSGLGLAITKELVELHNGSLHLESQIGEGTCITIRLPK